MLCSICIPCYKRSKQVVETLNSIYKDNEDVSLSDYEVVISDNDPDLELKDSVAVFFDRPNFRYIPTKCEGFLNSYYALSYGKGNLLKLHNSQNKIRKGCLAKIIELAKNFSERQPLIFCSNGFLEQYKIWELNDFNSFMYNLSYWSSWSGGMTIWKDDFEKLKEVNLNPLFPHTSLIVTQYNKEKYLIDDRILYDVQRVPQRAGHNKFEAFSVHYPSLILKCYLEKHISAECKKTIIEDVYKKYIPTLLFNKYIARIEKFDASGFRENCNRYFPKYAFEIAWLNVLLVPFQMIKRRLQRKIKLFQK